MCLFVAMCLLTIMNVNAQTSPVGEKCGSDNYLTERLQNDPEFALKFKEWIAMNQDENFVG